MSIAASFEIDYLQFLDESGQLVRTDVPAFARDVRALIDAYQWMVFTRTFDGKAIALQRTGKLGTYASCLGMEACFTAIGAALTEDDALVPYYRDYAAQFQRGVKPRDVLMYWGGDERGSNFSGPAHDFPWCVPIASQCLHAAGSALAFKIRKEPRVALATVGDGGTSKGEFYSALNAGGAFALPLVVVIVNNQYAISVPRAQQSATKTLAQKGIAAGIDSVQVDGNDVIALRVALDHAIKRARHGHGASLIEAVTYRLSDHTTADDARRYRSEDEVKAAWQREPIQRLRTYLMGMNAWSDAEEKDWLAQCSARIDEEIDAYLGAAHEPLSAMFDHTYLELPLDLERQRASALALAKG